MTSTLWMAISNANKGIEVTLAQLGAGGVPRAETPFLQHPR